jgi:hypothetical protein
MRKLFLTPSNAHARCPFTPHPHGDASRSIRFFSVEVEDAKTLASSLAVEGVDRKV